MDVFPTNASQSAATGPDGNSRDPRLASAPDYGTLGPGSDVAKSYIRPSSAKPPFAGVADPHRRTTGDWRVLQLVAVLAGILSALLVVGGGPFAGSKSLPGKTKSTRVAPSHENSAASSARLSELDLDRQKPQKQAEILLTQAVSRNHGAADQIQSHVESWRGKLSWNSQLSDLTTVALNSNDQNVRASAIEVQLAAYGLAKNQATVDQLIRQADSSDHAQKIWALWTLGLLGNRGIEADRVIEVLTAHGKDSGDEDARRWAVEGLALVGATATIQPLLNAMHNDPSALVRERAACSLAESGMLTHEQRMTALPQLINYSDDPALDAQTHGWAFQALRDISQQPLPNDSAAWRSWYQNRGPEY